MLGNKIPGFSELHSDVLPLEGLPSDESTSAKRAVVPVDSPSSDFTVVTEPPLVKWQPQGRPTVPRAALGYLFRGKPTSIAFKVLGEMAHQRVYRRVPFVKITSVGKPSTTSGNGKAVAVVEQKAAHSEMNDPDHQGNRLSEAPDTNSEGELALGNDEVKEVQHKPDVDEFGKDQLVQEPPDDEPESTSVKEPGVELIVDTTGYDGATFKLSAESDLEGSEAGAEAVTGQSEDEKNSALVPDLGTQEPEIVTVSPAAEPQQGSSNPLFSETVIETPPERVKEAFFPDLDSSSSEEEPLPEEMPQLSENDDSGLDNDELKGDDNPAPSSNDKEPDVNSLTSLESLHGEDEKPTVGFFSMSSGSSNAVVLDDSIPPVGNDGPAELSPAEKRLRDFKNKAKSKKGQRVKQTRELSQAIQRLQTGESVSDVLDSLANYSIGRAMYGAKSITGKSMTFAKNEDFKLGSIGVNGKWNTEDQMLRRKVKRLLFFAFEAAEYVEDKNSNGQRYQCIKNLSAFMDENANVSNIKKDFLENYLVPLVLQGALPGFATTYQDTIDRLREGRDDEVVQFYHEGIEAAVRSEYNRLMSALDELSETFRIHLGKGEYLEQQLSRFGETELENFVVSSNSKEDEGVFRAIRLRGVIHSFEEVLPWLNKASPVVKAYDDWKNTVRREADRLGEKADPQSLEQYRQTARSLLAKFSELENERYKMPEHTWRRVVKTKEDLEKVSNLFGLD